jgi:Serine/threonine protein phosphatase
MKNLRFEAACYSHIGNLRSNNQDNFLFSGTILPADNHGSGDVMSQQGDLTAHRCFAVLDGMGGEANGEQAAFLAAQTLQINEPSLQQNPMEELKHSCLQANERICQASTSFGGGRMGSTAAIALFYENQGWFCNVGDSRIFRLRDSILTQISEDHTDANLMHELGISGRKPHLTQHLGIWPDEMELEPYITSFPIEAGDQYLLCSDGLTDMVQLQELTKYLSGEASSSDAVGQLAELALINGGRDNVTIIICQIKMLEPSKGEFS